MIPRTLEEKVKFQYAVEIGYMLFRIHVISPVTNQIKVGPTTMMYCTKRVRTVVTFRTSKIYRTNSETNCRSTGPHLCQLGVGHGSTSTTAQRLILLNSFIYDRNKSINAI